MMKSINAILCLLAAATFLFVACRKEAVIAQFTTNKDTYAAGETVHCTNVSTNADSWKWTAPDGTTYTTRDLDYTLDSTLLNTTKTFKLEVTGHGDNSTYSKSINVKELILPTDYFSQGSTSYTPVRKSQGINSVYYWRVAASDGANGALCYNELLVFFYGATSPAAGRYSCQSSDPTAPNQVYVQVGAPTGIECANVHWYISASDSLDVSYTGSGKLRITFNNVHSTLGPLISGDITCH